MALAEFVGGSVEGFAELMNQKAVELGLTNTHFVTPHGLDQEEHYTTAYELAILTDYALKNEKFASIVATKTCQIHINGNPKDLSNTNELLGNLNGVDGVKTGFTNGAGRCLVTSTTRNGHQIICVVLGADTKKIRTSDSIKLIEYAFSNHQYINAKEKIEEQFQSWLQQEAKSIEYTKTKTKQIEYELEENPITWIPIPKDQEKDLSLKIEYEKNLEAPTKKGYAIGTMQLVRKEEVLLEQKIKLKQDIEKKQVSDYLQQLISEYTYYLMDNIKP